MSDDEAGSSSPHTPPQWHSLWRLIANNDPMSYQSGIWRVFAVFFFVFLSCQLVFFSAALRARPLDAVWASGAARHALTAWWGGSRWQDGYGGPTVGESLVARQVVHAGVETVSVSSFVPHASAGWGRGGAGRGGAGSGGSYWGCAVETQDAAGYSNCNAEIACWSGGRWRGGMGFPSKTTKRCKATAATRGLGAALLLCVGHMRGQTVAVVEL